MNPPKLFMLLLGCKPKDRNTEQHDVFFSIGHKLNELKNDIVTFWPEAKNNIHIDAWREVTKVDGYAVQVRLRTQAVVQSLSSEKLFFLNLGGYVQDIFEEVHYKLLIVSVGKGAAVKQAKQTAFYKHAATKYAPSHIDEKYGVDVDDMHEIIDILPPVLKEKFTIVLSPSKDTKEDELHLGYVILKNL